MKELIANGFKRTRKGLNGEDDDDGKWKSRRKQERVMIPRAILILMTCLRLEGCSSFRR